MIRLLRDVRGTAAIETALVTTFLLLPITSGVTGTGMVLLEQYRLDRGLHAGLIYAWSLPTATASQVQAAAIAGYGSYSPATTATATNACYCITPTGTRASGTAVACTGTCNSGQVMGTWVTLTTATTFTPVFGYTWGKNAWSLSATGTVRIQ